MTRSIVALLLAACLLGCSRSPRTAAPPPAPAADLPASDEALLDDVERRTFHYFWDLNDPHTFLVPDRAPTPSFSSIAAVGFGLTAYGAGAERGYVTRAQAAERTLATLRSLLAMRQGPEPRGVSGYKGFFYHFLDMKTGERFEKVELSTIDTALLMAGVLFSQSYFDRDDPAEAAIRAAAGELYARVDWPWIQPRKPRVGMGWKPEDGFHTYDWSGYDEAMILYVLALGSPTHPVEPAAWEAWTRTYDWSKFYGQEYVTFNALFGHQYSHVWIDFRGIQDAYMRGKGIDYFENSRRATYSQRTYAIENPGQWRGYGENLWGLTACDGPLDVTLHIDGRDRTFHTYWARGVSPREITDDGTLAPTAAVSSLPFAPEIVLPAIREMRRRFGAPLYGKYGFVDAFNPTFDPPLEMNVKPQHGHVARGAGWFDHDYLGIDQGPIVAMIENHRSGLVWNVMRKNPHIVRGLRRAGFTGGWLEGAPR